MLKLIQKPNAPLIIALSGWLVGYILGGSLHKIGQVIFIISLTIWAYLEVTKGANWFRRLLGAVTLLFIIFILFNQLK